MRAEDDPLTYAYLKALGRHIGVELSVNTSFNVAGPIAQTPQQAIDTLRRSKGLDARADGRGRRRGPSPRGMAGNATAGGLLAGLEWKARAGGSISTLGPRPANAGTLARANC